MIVLTLLVFINKLILIKAYCDACALFQHHVDLTVFLQANVCPRAAALSDWTSNNDTFAVPAPFGDFEMMVTFQGIHKTWIFEGIWSGEERLPQILRCLDVFQITNEKLCGRDLTSYILHFMCAIVWVHNDFIDLEESACSCYLSDQVSLELKRLSIIYDWGRNNYWYGKASLSLCVRIGKRSPWFSFIIVWWWFWRNTLIIACSSLASLFDLFKGFVIIRRRFLGWWRGGFRRLFLYYSFAFLANFLRSLIFATRLRIAFTPRWWDSN